MISIVKCVFYEYNVIRSKRMLTYRLGFNTGTSELQLTIKISKQAVINVAVSR